MHTYEPPAYITIAAHLRDQITTGALAKGARLPSERDLCDQHHVSGITARAAINCLRQEGLVETIRGKGVYVRHVTPLVRLSPERYFRPHDRPTWVAEAERAGRDVQYTHTLTQTAAPPDIAERLGVEDGAPATRIDYAFTMDDEPVSTSVCWEPLALTGGTPIQHPHTGPLADRGIIPRFDSIGVRVDSIHEVVNCRMPTPGESRALRLPSGVPVAAITQTFWAGERPVETADIVFAGDRYELHYRMPIPRFTPVDPAAYADETVWPWGTPL